MSTVTIHGTVTSTPRAGDTSTAGYGVDATLLRLIRLGEDANAETLTTPAAGTTRVADNGTFRLAIDGEGEALGPVDLTVAAPDGTVVARRSLSLQEATKPQKLRVSTLIRRTITAVDDPAVGERVILSGRVIDLAGRNVPGGLPVVLWGVPQGGAAAVAPQPFVVSETVPGGYFSAPWPADQLQSAEGRVSGRGAVPVPLDADGRLPLHVLLPLDLAGVAGIDDACQCGELPPRAPEPGDLTADPASFSQDLGAGCVDLTTPNRTIEEFTYRFVLRTSEPNVKGFTLGARRKVPPELLGDLLGVAVATDVLHGRSAALGPGAGTGVPLELDVQTARHLVRSDRPPNVEGVARAAWLSEVGRAKDLIDAALIAAPGRRELDADDPIDWDETPTIHQTIELAHGHVLHMREVWRADGFSLGDLLYSLPLAPLQRRRIAVVDWERRSTSTRAERLEFEEQLDAMVGRDRDVSEIVHSELREETRGGSHSSTWGVAGGIGAGFIGSGFGIFGGVAGGASGSDATAWQRSSRTFAADSLQRLRDRVTQRASGLRDERSTVVQSVAQGETVRAETEVVANYNRCHALTVEYFEVLRHFLVSHELAHVSECLFVPLPMSAFDRGKALRWRDPLARRLRDRRLGGGFTAIRRIADNWVGWDYPASRYSEEAPEALEGELRISFVLPRPRDDEDGAFQIDQWRPWSWLFRTDTLELWTANLNERTARDRDQVYRTTIAPEIAEALVQRLRFAYVTDSGEEIEVPLDPTLVSRYVEGVPLYVTLNPRGAIPPVAREDISYFKVWYDGAELPPDARVIVHSGKVRYRSPHSTGVLFASARILDDLRSGDPVVVPTPVSRWDLRDPRAEDRDLADRLVAHLNEHIEHYHQAIWVSLDAQRRYMLLDGIEVAGLGGRSVASVCSNELIGIAGNALVLPLAPGQRLDPTIDTGDENNEPVPLLDAYNTNPLPPIRVSAPTRGVYAEAVAGECSGCEPIDDTRYWRWSPEGLLEPPEIQPVSTETRATDEPDLTPTALPTPLVSIQNAPELPPPAGLSDVFGLLATKDLFRDLTGLEGTQKNAMAAFEASMSAAAALGTEAAKLAGQNELGRNAGRMLDRIDQARKDGLLTPGAAQDLSKSALQGLLGETRPAAAPPTEDEAVKKVVDEAGQSSKAEIKVSSPSETVEVSFDDDEPTVGAAPKIGQLDVASFVSQDAVFDEVRNIAGSRVLIVRRAATMSELKGIVGNGRVTALSGAGLLRADPADATLFQILRRLRILYPANAKDTDKVRGTKRLPVVVIVHGQHSPADVNHEGFTYLQEELARLGIVSVSVDTNIANALQSRIEMRAESVLGALDALRDMDGDAASRFHKRLNFDKVGMVGHSRGGDAVVKAAILNRARSAPTRYGVTAVCAIAPTDFTGTLSTPSFVNRLGSADTEHLLVLYGGLDGDVAGFGGASGRGGTGFRHYDRASTQKSMVFLDECNHNRFNSVWTADDRRLLPSDVGSLVSRAGHEQLAKEYVGGLFSWKLLGSPKPKSLLDGTTTNSVGANAAIQWSFGTRVTALDDFETAAATVGTRALIGATVQDMASVVGVAAVGGKAVNERTNHQTGVLAIGPNAPGPPPDAYKLTLPAAARDWSGFDLLTVRACADADVSVAAKTAASDLPDFTLVITDTDGKSAVVDIKSLFTPSRPRRPRFHEAKDPNDPSKTENCTAIRLETLAVRLASLSGINRRRIASLAVSPPAGFKVHQFLDSFELVKR
jgi:hypothetical protein